MKARFLRDDLEYKGPDGGYQDATYLRDVVKNKSKMKVLCWKKGAVVEDPKAFRLVQFGVAEPADGECEKRAGMTPEKMTESAYAYERLARGITPEDFDRYNAGEIIGYKEDGSDIKGPNWISPDNEEDEEEEDDDE